MTGGSAGNYKGWTALPNYYHDCVIPRVTKLNQTAALILLMLGREIIGWRGRTSAEISNREFCEHLNISEPTVVKTLTWLIERGYVVRLRQGNGLQKSEYSLHFDRSGIETIQKKKELTPESEICADTITDPQDSEPSPPQANPPSVVEDGTDAKETAIQPAPQKGHTVSCLGIEIAVNGDPSETSGGVSYYPAEVQAKSEPEPGENVDNPNEIKGQNGFYPSYKKDLEKDNILGKELTNKERAEFETLTKQARSVCFLFRSLKYEIKNQSDFGFIRWCIQVYGYNQVNHKLQVMTYQKKRDVKHKNPIAWLRIALEQDYGFSQADIDLERAREKHAAEIGLNNRLKEEQRERERAFEEGYKKNPNAANEAFAAFVAMTEGNA